MHGTALPSLAVEYEDGAAVAVAVTDSDGDDGVTGDPKPYPADAICFEGHEPLLTSCWAPGCSGEQEEKGVSHDFWCRLEGTGTMLP